MSDYEKDNDADNLRNEDNLHTEDNLKENISNEKDKNNIEALESDKKLSEEKSAPEKKKTVIKEILSWVYTIIGAVILAYIITTFIIVNAVVPTGSMKDTIEEGDRLIAFRLSYLFDDPSRYDIVVFKNPDNEDVLFIKRIIGLPGEKISIKYENGKTNVYVNDSETPLKDDFLREPMMFKGENKDIVNGELVYNVPEGCYFMLGDNRNESHDSRFWNNMFVEKDKILGKALFKYYPSIDWIDDEN